MSSYEQLVRDHAATLSPEQAARVGATREAHPNCLRCGRPAEVTLAEAFAANPGVATRCLDCGWSVQFGESVQSMLSDGTVMRFV